MLNSLLRRSYGSLVMLANLPGQKRIPYLPRKKVSSLRDARLRRIVKYAVETVPYYRDFFRQNGLSWKDVRTADDLRRLPIIAKELVHRDPRRFVSCSQRGKNAILFTTSGSTGVPLKIWIDRRSLLAQAAFGARERDVVREFLGKEVGYKWIQLVYLPATSEKIWSFYKDSAFTPVKPDRMVVSASEPLENIYKKINEFRPDVIAGYGSFIDLLFKYAVGRNIRIHLPRLIRFGADIMPACGRELIENKLGVPVLSSYGLVECLKVGFECGNRRGFHLHEDLCHVRIIKSDGKDALPGEKGEVVISNLVNYGTVLLNYQTGDLATLSPADCPCGRTSSLLSDLEGRIEDTIILEDGRFVHPSVASSVFVDEPDILQFQLIQHSFSKFELKLVTRNPEDFDEVLPRVRLNLKKLLGTQAKIEAEYHQALDKPESGKFSCVKSLCNPIEP